MTLLKLGNWDSSYGNLFTYLVGKYNPQRNKLGPWRLLWILIGLGRFNYKPYILMEGLEEKYNGSKDN